MKRFQQQVISFATCPVALHLKTAIVMSVSALVAAAPICRQSVAQEPQRVYPGVILSKGSKVIEGQRVLSQPNLAALALKSQRLSRHAQLLLPAASSAAAHVPSALGKAPITCDSPSVRQVLRSLGRGATCSLNHELRIERTPNDPRFEQLYAPALMRLPEAWDTTTGRDDIVVQVIDTGIKADHPDLAANLFINPGEIAGNNIDDDGNGFIDDVHGINAIDGSGDPFDDHRHGTHVAGTIGAAGDNQLGVTGVAWRVKLSPCKFLGGPAGSGSAADAIRCIDYGVSLKSQGINVIASNNSWGSSEFNPALRDAILRSEEAGIMFVAAAGNNQGDNDVTPLYPASFGYQSSIAGVISVASITSSRERSFFSNFGRNSVHLAAPGSEIFSTCNGTSACVETPGADPMYAKMSGTSMAAPQVTGVLALAQSVCSRSLTIAEMRRVLLETVTPTQSMNGITVTGGIVNAKAAVDLARAICSESIPTPAPSTTPTETFTASPSVTATFTPTATATGVETATETATVSPIPAKTPPPGRTTTPAPTRTVAPPITRTPTPVPSPVVTGEPTTVPPTDQLVCEPAIQFSQDGFTRITGGVSSNTGVLQADGTGFETVGSVAVSYPLPSPVTVDDRTVLRVVVQSRGPGDAHTIGLEDDDVFTHEKALIWAALSPYQGPNYFGVPNYHGCYNESCFAVEGERFYPPRPWGFSKRIDIPVGIYLDEGTTYDRLAAVNSGGHAKIESVQLCRAPQSLRPARTNCFPMIVYRPQTREVFGFFGFPEITGRTGLGRIHVNSVKVAGGPLRPSSEMPGKRNRLRLSPAELIRFVDAPFARRDEFQRLIPGHEPVIRERVGEFFYVQIPASIREDQLKDAILRVETEGVCKPISSGLRRYIR